ncbi:unnamed protein product [Effrenium voratum]|uniref:Uncharacterized protein n=1 Tax=Effrenium voratum TaxID=2562239 RepID=A0AA36ILF1_9DINO|nr:unnamed protein product [Effrenium voratum]
MLAKEKGKDKDRLTALAACWRSAANFDISIVSGDGTAVVSAALRGDARQVEMVKHSVCALRVLLERAPGSPALENFSLAKQGKVLKAILRKAKKLELPTEAEKEVPSAGDASKCLRRRGEELLDQLGAACLAELLGFNRKTLSGLVRHAEEARFLPGQRL